MYSYDRRKVALSWDRSVLHIDDHELKEDPEGTLLEELARAMDLLGELAKASKVHFPSIHSVTQGAYRDLYRAWRRHSGVI